MKQTGKIDYVEIPSSDIDSTKRFFSEVFDWSFVDYGPEYAAIENAGLDGGFFKSEQHSRSADGSVLVVLYSAELEVTLEKVKAAGGRIIQDIFDFPGGRRFHFLEPCGNEYAVWSEPSA